ncbi:MAG: hypothetical protein KC646_00865 [Candidatus Cloacimonetes bacterium]|nr:hypothetical protein [Candidatus Cloacimonadota bacterium]
MKDYPVIDLDYLLRASNDRSHKKMVTLQVKTLRQFLIDNDLLNADGQQNLSTFDKTTRVLKSDLTEVGYILMDRSLFKWLNAHDSGKDVEDVRYLEKNLAKILRRRQSNTSSIYLNQ